MRDIASPQPESPSVVAEDPVPLVEEGGAEDTSAASVEGSPVVPAEPPLREQGRVLVAHAVPSTTRLIRETLRNFTTATVETTSDPLRAFELALQKPFRLFLFAMEIGELTGPMLYELISTAYSAGRGAKQLAPAVVFIREKDDPKLPEELTRDVRVKDVLTKPLRIERFLEAIGGSIEVRDPTGR